MQKVRLKSDGIGTEFVFADIRSNSGYVDVRISVDLPEEMGRWPMPMAACRLFKGDLERLLQYFRSHTKGLLDGSLSESAVFVPSEIGFQIRALDGDVESMLDGYFTIEVMNNYGLRKEGYDSLYLGFSSVIDLVNLNEFCARIEAIAIVL